MMFVKPPKEMTTDKMMMNADKTQRFSNSVGTLSTTLLFSKRSTKANVKVMAEETRHKSRITP